MLRPLSGKAFLAFVLGDALVFVGGILSLHFLGKMGWSAAVAVGLTPFIIPDLIKGLIVTLVTKPVLKALKVIATLTKEKKRLKTLFL